MPLYRIFAYTALTFTLVFNLSYAAEPLELNREYPPADEVKTTEKVVGFIRMGYAFEAKRLAKVNAQVAELLRLDKKTEAAKLKAEYGKVTRDAHAKGHGCVKANFQVLDGLPENLRHGVFAYDGEGAAGKPKNYTAWVRFSNGSSKVQPDWVPDGRGMAIKLTGVTGDKLLADEKSTQDFLMINFPEFFVRNVKDYVEFNTLKAQGKEAEFFATPERKKTEGRIAVAIASQFVTSPLEAQYFSMVPVRLGNAAIKYSAKPCTDKQTVKFGELDLAPLVAILKSVKKPEELAAHAKALQPYNAFLEKGLRHQVAEQDTELCFDFLVQFQTKPNTQRIEDGTDHWDSEFHKVARITVRKNIVAPAEFCENLAFTPWHSVAAHRPIGGIQRVRKPIYQVSSEERHKLNVAKQLEPTGLEFERPGRGR